MILFVNDYQEGCLPEIIKKMQECNLEKNCGYGVDVHCERAKELIKQKIENESCDVHFISGGTLTNKIVISTFLKPYEGVICADTGHIAVHETGAIELGGHKALCVKNVNGKVLPSAVEMLVNEHIEGLSREHTVKPGMVYISQSTEVGTVYTLSELQELSNVCKKYNLLFFIDGARILSSLFSTCCDYTLKDVCALCDVFYIGGTKAGALFGEALVINKKQLQENFRYVLKQNGALLAKGFALGIQFEALFENDNYAKYARSAVEKANRIRQCLVKKNILLEFDSYDTQTFAIFTTEQYGALEQRFNFGGATFKNGMAYARICTSWATTEDDVNALILAISEL